MYIKGCFGIVNIPHEDQLFMFDITALDKYQVLDKYEVLTRKINDLL